MEMFEDEVLEVPEILNEEIFQEAIGKLINKFVSKNDFEEWLAKTVEESKIANSACLDSVLKTLTSPIFICSNEDLNEMYFCLKHHIIYQEDN